MIENTPPGPREPSGGLANPSAIDGDDVRSALQDPTECAVMAFAMGRYPETFAIPDLVEEVGRSRATIYRHVRNLVEKGLLVSVRDAVTREGRRCQVYRSTIVEASLAVGPVGPDVVWTPAEEIESGEGGR